MGSTRWRGEAALAGLFAVVMLVGAGGAVWIMSRTPVHENAAAVPSTAASGPSDRYSGAIDESGRLARALVAGDNLPGLSVAVAVDGAIVWAEGFGYADVERRAPVTPRTRFRTGSVSKTLTAAGLAVLYERGRIDLDAPVQTYVPGYPGKPWTITTRQLMGDVGGVHRIRGDNNDSVPRDHCGSLDQALQIFAGEPLLFEPGTSYRFSTYGWILLSAAIEGAAAEPFSTFMSREVFAPLGMDRTTLEDTAPQHSGSDRNAEDDRSAASFYFMTRAVGINVGVESAPAADYSCFFGAGAFLSTPTDLVHLGSAMLKPGVLNAKTIALFQQPLQLASGVSTGFALGWKVDRILLGGMPARVVRHRGSLIGGTISLSMFPDFGVVIAAASNVTQADRVDPFTLEVAEVFTRQQARHAGLPLTGATSEIGSRSHRVANGRP